MNETARWNKIVNRLAGQLANIQVQLTALTVQIEELLEENAKLKKLNVKEKGNGSLASGGRTGDASGAGEPEVAAAE